MDLRELISLIVSLLVMAVFMGQGLFDKVKRKKELEARRKEDSSPDYTLEEFLSEVTHDAKKKKKQPEKPIQPPHEEYDEPVKPLPIVSTSRRTTKDDFRFQTDLDAFKQKSAVEERAFKTEVEQQPYNTMGAHIVSEDLDRPIHDEAYTLSEEQHLSLGERLIRKPQGVRDMVIYSEIFGKPKWI